MKEPQHAETKDPETKPTHDEVAKRAYAISEQEGHPPGHAEQDWLEAEAQLQHAGSDQPREHGILLTPALGAVLMSASTVIVAINARLLRLKNDKPLKKGETT